MEFTPLRRSCAMILTLLLCYLIPSHVAAQNSDKENITPPQVLVRVGTVRNELEELRFLMGRPKNSQPEMNVKAAAPREVYFQALTLFRKTDRLCFEHTRKRTKPPELPEGEITPGNVYRVVDSALMCVRQVKTKYGLQRKSDPPEIDETKQPTDVFKSIVQANRQLNVMLDRRFAPSDVFEQVTQGVGYTSRLLQHFPDATWISDEPAYESGKRPADVYRRLLGCLERIREVAEQSGVEMLELEIDESQIQQAEPSDVYDIASLIVAELAYLHSKLDDSKPPRVVFFVGRKFPSHAYQRAGILDHQLIELQRWAKEHPDWLKQKTED